MLFSSLSLRLTQRKLFLLQIKTRVFFSFSIILNTKKINKLLRKSAANENVLFMLSLPQLFFSLEMLHNVYSIYDFSDLNTASNQVARQCNETFSHRVVTCKSRLSVSKMLKGLEKQLLDVT